MTNKYGSVTDSLIGINHYSLPLVSTPPAAESIAAAGLATAFGIFRKKGGTQYVGALSTLEKPRILGAGLFANLADGMVLNTGRGFGEGFDLTLALCRMAAPLTGDISNTAGTDAIVGAGTLFTEELAVGQTISWYDDNDVLREGLVAVITDDTNVTLQANTPNTGMFTGGDTTNKTCYPFVERTAGESLAIPLLTLNQIYPFDFFLGDVSKVRPPVSGGLITVTAASDMVTGFKTQFLSEVTPGTVISWVDDSGDPRKGVVASVLTDTTLQLAFAADTNATRVPRLFYDDHLRIMASLLNAFDFGTISMDPAYAGQLLNISSLLVCEHSEALDGFFV